MTKLPPGRPSFPHWLDNAGPKTSGEMNLSKPDRKRIVEKVAAGTTPEEALGELLAEKSAAKLARMKPDVAERCLRDLCGNPATREARRETSSITYAGERCINCMTCARIGPWTA